MKPQRTLSSYSNISLYRSNRKPPRTETTMPVFHLGLGIAFVVGALIWAGVVWLVLKVIP